MGIFAGILTNNERKFINFYSINDTTLEKALTKLNVQTIIN